MTFNWIVTWSSPACAQCRNPIFERSDAFVVVSYDLIGDEIKHRRIWFTYYPLLFFIDISYFLCLPCASFIFCGWLFILLFSFFCAYCFHCPFSYNHFFIYVFLHFFLLWQLWFSEHIFSVFFNIVFSHFFLNFLELFSALFIFAWHLFSSCM